MWITTRVNKQTMTRPVRALTDRVLLILWRRTLTLDIDLYDFSILDLETGFFIGIWDSLFQA